MASNMTAHEIEAFAEILTRARRGDQAARARLLEPARDFLRLLTIHQLDARLNGRVDPSDVVHETFISALGSLEQFRGMRQPEFYAWLRTIHGHVLLNLAREHIATEKRSVNREFRLSTTDTPLLIACGDNSPSANVMQAEIVRQLIHSLEQLPFDQREAVRLRYFEERTLEEIACHLRRSQTAAAGLLKRGLKALRIRLAAPSEELES